MKHLHLFRADQAHHVAYPETVKTITTRDSALEIFTDFQHFGHQQQNSEFRSGSLCVCVCVCRSKCMFTKVKMCFACRFVFY